MARPALRVRAGVFLAPQGAPQAWPGRTGGLRSCRWGAAGLYCTCHTVLADGVRARRVPRTVLRTVPLVLELGASLVDAVWHALVHVPWVPASSHCPRAWQLAVPAQYPDKLQTVTPLSVAAQPPLHKKWVQGIGLAPARRQALAPPKLRVPRVPPSPASSPLSPARRQQPKVQNTHTTPTYRYLARETQPNSPELLGLEVQYAPVATSSLVHPPTAHPPAT